MERDLRRMKDLSLETGLMGISCYISLRLLSISHKAIEESFDTLLSFRMEKNNK